MRLKKLILHGFKSFADRTEFVFDAPITGIVGPNGCGKSNVVDGFKWVLGEQSAKSLRGDAMLDVIFNGAAGRKPSGMAEVTLVFENPKREDGTRLLNLDTDEVAVGRRLFRDGTSEYQLNNTSSRLKDIRELFLDTGVGVDAYSVIEQGKVAAMLEANPAERRLIFEEAAGISKYKVKKKEAQRKLERVDQNLLRVHDIVEEVEKRLRSVKVQAGRARTFQEHSTRLNELRLGYSLQEYHTLRIQADDLQAQQESGQFQLDDVAADLARQQADLTAHREQLEATGQSKQQAEYQLVQAQAQLESSQRQQHYAQQQLDQIAEQIQQFEADRATAEARLAETSASLEADHAILRELTDRLSSCQREIAEKQQAYRDGQLKLNELAQQTEQHKNAVLDLMRRTSAASSRLSSIEIERKNIIQQEARLNDRRQVVIDEITTVETAGAQLDAQLAEMTQAFAARQTELSDKQHEAAALGKQIAMTGDELAAAREHRSGMLSRQQLLSDLEARREGVSEGVKAVLRQKAERFPFVRGIVADVLRVDVEHAQVIEAALNGQDQTLLTHSQAAAADASEQFAELSGRVNFICADRLPAFVDGYDWNRHAQRVRLAADLVKFEAADRAIVEHLLGKTVIVDALSDARILHETGPVGYRYVTHSGEVIEADGVLRAGPLTAAMGLLSRRSELDALALQLAEVDARIAALTARFTESSAQAKAFEEEMNTLRNALYALNASKVKLTSQIAQTNDRLSALKKEQPVLERELENFLEQHRRLSEESDTLAARKAELEAEQASRQQQIEQTQQEHESISQHLRAWNEDLTAARVALGQLQEKQLGAEQAVQRQTAQQVELRQQIERLIRSAQQTEARREQNAQELAAAKHAEQTLARQQQELRERAEALAARLASQQQETSGFAQRVDALTDQHAALQAELHQVELRAGELKVRLETLVQRTLEEIQLDLPARYLEGYQADEQDWDAIAAEIKELREKIQRLGNVNLDSLTELDDLEQRSTFYATQLTDLNTSKEQLSELINTINVESSLRFEQTFNAVREHFQGMFRKLFGGGKADVYLETELEEKALPAPAADGEEIQPVVKKTIDILDAGIEIIAKPPGKQPCSISQLSGGEKTMTCVALLMSIFKSKPSPFCILDEVDAALDEANNQRFNLIVQEFLEMSQFIVITHSKRTMQIADVLYGVTMQEQGVSKRVAVKFEQVDSQGRINETAAA